MAKSQGMSEEGKERLREAGLVVDKKGHVRVKRRRNKTRRGS